VKFAIYLPTIRDFADVRVLADLAVKAEARGWDGCFIWDVLCPSDAQWSGPAVDSWVALGVIASRTERIRLGTMVTPMSRRRPWKLARETLTIDHLSRGRLVLGVGLGDPSDLAGEILDAKVRAEMLDEGLELLQKLWTGQRVAHSGKHYQFDSPGFLPSALQAPRIPVWVGGSWPHRQPLKRAVRWDGYFPAASDAFLEPSTYREIASEISALRGDALPFDLVVGTTMDGASPSMEDWFEYELAGATWWLHEVDTVEAALDRIDAGPPQR
jgi:alkanesulfonate monooxygenase SsuD/methylene tetrahydromethanopterin reductase-like flavin-dependent oxidoreductase (luciferase family)